MKNNLMSKWLNILLPLVMITLASISSPVAASNDTFESLVVKLAENNFKDKEQTIDALMIASSQKSEVDDRVLAVFQTLLKGSLYFQKSDKQTVYVTKVDGKYSSANVLDNVRKFDINKRSVKKITLNNKLRRKLRGYIAELSLLNKNPKIRISAIQEMMGTITLDTIVALQQRLINEKNKDVLAAFETLVALVEVDADDKAIRLSALTKLGDSLVPKARNKIIGLLEKDDKGHYFETDKDFINASLILPILKYVSPIYSYGSASRGAISVYLFK